MYGEAYRQRLEMRLNLDMPKPWSRIRTLPCHGGMGEMASIAGCSHHKPEALGQVAGYWGVCGACRAVS